MPRLDAAMPASGFLHDHPNFVDLLRQLAQQTGIATYLIEKDYWLMHGLWVLQQQGWQFQLKGGTSLSKGFGIIQRFSEDIDLRIEPPFHVTELPCQLMPQSLAKDSNNKSTLGYGAGCNQ